MQKVTMAVISTLAILVIPCAISAQQKLTPVTVCEVLSNLNKFSGKPVVIVGRLDCSWSLIDHTCYLSEDQCKRPVTTEGYVWPNQIIFKDNWKEGMPKPPTGNPEITDAAVLRKISSLRKTTKLGFHKEPRFKQEKGALTFSEMADVKDEWGVAYGRVFTAPKLKKDNCDDNEVGCGGFEGAPAVLIMKREFVRTYQDEGGKLQLTKH
jgi:hypothetical protein